MKLETELLLKGLKVGLTEEEIKLMKRLGVVKEKPESIFPHSS